MNTDTGFFNELIELSKKKAKVYLLTEQVGKLGVILGRIGGDDMKVIIDDSKEWEYFDNGDEVMFSIDDILGYELR